jgi:hypothetical protein
MNKTGKRKYAEVIDPCLSPTGTLCLQAQEVFHDDLKEELYIFINDSSEPGDLRQYMFELSPEELGKTYIFRRLMVLMTQKKEVFNGVHGNSFEGMVGPAEKTEFCTVKGKYIVVPARPSQGDEDDAPEMEEGEETEEGQRDLFEEFIQRSLKPYNAWPRRDFGHKELASVKWTVNWHQI